jgi:hypothetical protein
MSRHWPTYLLYSIVAVLIMSGAVLGFAYRTPGLAWALIVIGLGVLAGGANADGDAPRPS